MKIKTIELKISLIHKKNLISLEKDFNDLSTQTNEIINAAKKGILDQQSSLDDIVKEINQNINNVAQNIESTITNSSTVNRKQLF